MMHAYSELYLDDAMQNLGDMLEYAVKDCGFDADSFFRRFVQSTFAEEFGSGSPKVIGGMSGVELAREIVRQVGGESLSNAPSPNDDKSNIYWAGWSLAYYQWYKGISFAEILRGGLTISRILSMYILHEADISKFVEAADEVLRVNDAERPSRLQEIRKARGFTQHKLSETSGVALRMIQLYEQRRSDINKASAMTVMALSKALGCRMDDLLEAM